MKATVMPLHMLLDLNKNIYFSKSYSRKLFVVKKTQLDFLKNKNQKTFQKIQISIFKKSLFFDVFMKLGSVIFTVLKMKQQKKTIRKIEAYIVFSKEELNLKLNKKVTYLSSFELFKGAIEKDNKNVEIIFNTNAVFSTR